MKVFISSVIGGFEKYRDAVEEAAKILGLEVIRAENFTASTDSPQVACLKGVRESDIVVLLVGSRYGEIQASGFSATHEEFLEAKDKKPLIAFIEKNVTRDNQQSKFLDDVQSWSVGRFTETFDSATILKEHVTQALHKYIVSTTVASIDGEAISERAKQKLSDRNSRQLNNAAIEFSIAAGPTQTILRPAIIGKASLVEDIFKLAAFGNHKIFDISMGTKNHVKDNELVISQESKFIRINSQGDLLIQLSLKEIDQNSSVIIEENLQGIILRTLLFSAELLDLLDPTQRLSHVALHIQLLNADHYGWQTRQEHQNANGTYTISGFFNNKKSSVALSPPYFKRGGLKFDSKNIAEDILALLKRNHRGD